MIALELHLPEADPSLARCPTLEPLCEETVDLSEPEPPSIVLIAVFDPIVGDDVLIQVPYSGNVIRPEELVDESWLENMGLSDISRDVGRFDLELEVETDAVEAEPSVAGTPPIDLQSSSLLNSEVSLVREAVPLLIPPASEPTPVVSPPQKQSKRAWIPPASFSDRFNPSLPEGRRSAPRPIEWRRTFPPRHAAARENHRKDSPSDNVLDFAFVGRAFKVFAVLTFALALIALDMRFGRGLGLNQDTLAMLRMLAHLAIGGATVLLLRSSDPGPRR